MGKPIQDPDYPTEPPPVAAVLPPKNGRDPYYVIVGQNGAVYRLHRSRVARVVSDGNGRIVLIQLAETVH